jgi:hypothetical protein
VSINWSRAASVAPVAAAVSIVTAVSVITMVTSYEHEFQLAHHNGQVRWVACLLPFSVDGMVLVAFAATWWAAHNGVRGFRQLWPPLLTGAIGMAATIAANVFSDSRFWWLGPAVAGSSGVAVVLVGMVAHWMLATQRRLAAGESLQRSVNCSCPKPPASLAEALPLARQVLREAGLPHGQETLADRFGVTVHQVRKVLVPPVESKALMNGSGHE